MPSAPPFAVLFVYVALLLGVLNSVVSVLLQEISGHRYQGLKAFSLLLLTAVLENFGYRQLTVWWRLQGHLRLAPRQGGLGPHAAAGASARPRAPDLTP